MAIANEARVAIRVDDQSRAGFDSFKRSMSDLEGVFSRLRNVASAAFAVLAGGFGLREIATAGIEAEKSQARLAATLEATGYSAGLTQKQLEDLNDELVGLTEFDDEGIRNAQSQLLKFGEIAGANFERALKAAADFAAFTGTDLPAAAQVIGTALSNQEGGLGRLERQFGKLTKSEEDAIKALQDLGNVSGAQAAKLAIIESRIGGVAEKMNTGLNKSTKDLSKAWGDFLEEIARTDGVIGGTLNSALGTAANFFKNLRSEIGGTRTELSALVEKLSRFGGIVPNAARLALDVARESATGPVATGKIQPSAALAARMGEAAQAAAAERAIADKQEKEREERAKRLRSVAGSSGGDAKRALEAQRERGDRSYYDRLEALEQEYVDAGQRANEEILAQKRELRAQELKDAESYYARVAALEDQYVEQGQAANQARLDQLKEEANRSRDLARDLGLTFSSAFEEAISGGKSFREILKGIEQDLIKLATRKLVTEKLFDVFTRGVGAAQSGGVGGLATFIGGLFNAKGNVFTPSGVVPFAKGGVVDKPTLFPFSRGIGLMGEAGPEAIMPLKRTASGELGVTVSGISSAKGNVFTSSGVVPFAQGGIVDKPTLFPFSRGIGLMGEAGPEAIMPLKRTATGDLGVTVSGLFGSRNVSSTASNDSASAQRIQESLEPIRAPVDTTTRIETSQAFLAHPGEPLSTSAPGKIEMAGSVPFSAKGNVFAPFGVVPFARGDIIAKPTVFPFARGVGLMGEAGPEAIMPLRRNASGELGVMASETRGVTVNISMAGSADRRSAQQVAAEVGRAVARATRRNN